VAKAKKRLLKITFHKAHEYRATIVELIPVVQIPGHCLLSLEHFALLISIEGLLTAMCLNLTKFEQFLGVYWYKWIKQCKNGDQPMLPLKAFLQTVLTRWLR
jgi:hypothetical protein